MVERFPDKKEVPGSIPGRPTSLLTDSKSNVYNNSCLEADYLMRRQLQIQTRTVDGIEDGG